MNLHTAIELKLQDGDYVTVQQGEASLDLPFSLNEKVANDCVFINAGVIGSEKLGVSSGEINVKKKG